MQAAYRGCAGDRQRQGPFSSCQNVAGECRPTRTWSRARPAPPRHLSAQSGECHQCFERLAHLAEVDDGLVSEMLGNSLHSALKINRVSALLEVNELR